MQVADVDAIAGDVEAKFIAFSQRHAGLGTSSRHPHRERIGMMVSTIIATALDHRCPSKLSAPNHQRVFEQPSLLEILEQCRASLIGILAILFKIIDQVAVLIPSFVKELDKGGSRVQSVDGRAGNYWQMTTCPVPRHTVPGRVWALEKGPSAQARWTASEKPFRRH